MPRVRSATGLLLASLWLAAMLPVGARANEGESAEETLADFDEEEASDYGGFDEDEEEEESGGFHDEAGEGAGDLAVAEPRGGPQKLWELSGGVSLGTSYNYLDHRSATGTHYGNLSRLRAQLDLRVDLDLPADWKGRFEAWGFYDFVYLAKGRGQYTRDVLDDYEWEVDVREAWLQGSPWPSLDLKLGRQIVNWGRSDTVRVLDVINPLDNREPGLVDIENLRLPVAMARIDYYPKWIPRDRGTWSLQLLVIPEFREDRNPSIGNDFNPAPGAIPLRSNKPRQFWDTPEYGAAISGTFSGWDISAYAARLYLNQPLIVSTLAGALERYPRVTMVGAGGNLTFGSWLLKAEMGFFDGVEYGWVDTTTPVPTASVVEKRRLDTMAGVEYYGVSDLQIALELVHRHIFGFDEAMNFSFMGITLAYAKEDLLETALRVSANFFNSRLRVTGVALLLGTLTDVGSVVRLEASYELREAMTVSGGIVLYQKGTSPFFAGIGRNDRLFARLEYDF